MVSRATLPCYCWVFADCAKPEMNSTEWNKLHKWKERKRNFSHCRIPKTQRIKVEKSTQKQRINQSSVSQSFVEGLAEMEKCCLYDFAWFTVYSAPLPNSEIFIVRRLFTLSLTTQKILFKLWHSQSQINKQLYAVEKSYSYSLPLRKNHTFRPWKIIKKKNLWDQEQGCLDGRFGIVR